MSPTLDQSKEVTYKIHKAVFLLNKLSDQILQDRLNLGLSQFLVMMVLAGQSKVPQKFVATQLDQTQAAVSRQIDILVDLGYVSRDTNPESRREYVLSLTKVGQKVHRQAFEAIDERFDKLFGIWTKSEKSNLLGALNKLIMEIKTKGSTAICGSAGKRN